VSSKGEAMRQQQLKIVLNLEFIPKNSQKYSIFGI